MGKAPGLLAGAVAAGVLAVGGAAAADIVIKPGASIGKLRLGMPQAEALRAYRYPYVEREARPFGRERLEIEFGLSGYSAVLYGTRGRAKVVRVSTLSVRERTPEGVGVGTRERVLRRAYGGHLACDAPSYNTYPDGSGPYVNTTRNCRLRSRAVETIFRLHLTTGPRPNISYPVREWDADKAHVAGVTIQVVPQPR